MEAGIIRFSEFQFYKLKSGKYLYETLYFIMENHHYYIILQPFWDLNIMSTLKYQK